MSASSRDLSIPDGLILFLPAVRVCCFSILRR